MPIATFGVPPEAMSTGSTPTVTAYGFVEGQLTEIDLEVLT